MSKPETQTVDTVDLTFDSAFCEAIETGDKTATIRYGLWGSPAVGDRLRLVDAETNEPIGTARVRQVRRRQASDLAQNGVDGHADYDDVAALLAAMREYYPDARFTPETWFTVVHWATWLSTGSPNPRSLSSDRTFWYWRRRRVL